MTLKDLDHPRALVAHQQMADLFLLALLSTHPDPGTVISRFRKLVGDLTADADLISDESFLAAVQRSATRFDQLVVRLLPAAAPRPAQRLDIAQADEPQGQASVPGGQ